jgi:hypothetical protein
MDDRVIGSWLHASEEKNMSIRPPSEMAILRRIVDRKHVSLSKDAAKAILRLDFDRATS